MPARRQIAATRAAFAAALREGDAEAAAAVYAEEARLLPPSTELVQGRGQIQRFWQAGLVAGISEIEIDVFELRHRDGVAHEIGRYALRLSSAEGGTVVDRGKYTLVHERQEDGSWRRAVEMFSPDRPPATTGGSPLGWSKRVTHERKEIA